MRKRSIFIALSSIILVYLSIYTLQPKLALLNFENPIATTISKFQSHRFFTSTAESSRQPTSPTTPTHIFQEMTTEAEVPMMMSISRKILKTFQAVEKSEGAGAKVRRCIGVPQLRNFSPFLMLDHFSVGVGAGFPDHPHRGQETITYIIHGSVEHEDFAGHRGIIKAGDLQFMTAGKGIVHAEMPGENPDGSPNVGFQLWVDLPQKLKYCEPRYRDLRAEEIPSVEIDDNRVQIKIISGNSHGVDSVKDLAYTPVWLLDVTMQPGGKLSQPIPRGWNAFAYTYKGKDILFDGKTRVGSYYNVVFGKEGDGIEAVLPDNAREEAKFIIVAGQPHDQQIFQYGPFVVSSEAEIQQAMLDYQTSSNGFEKARDWQSVIARGMLRH